MVTLIGLGGMPDTLTLEAREALERSELVFGAQRLLESLPAREGQTRIAAVRAADILAQIKEGSGECPCVVYSGDTGFYSGAKGLLALLREQNIDCRVLPGVSSVQLLSARLGEPWQDWMLCSAHGVDCDPIAAVMQGKPAFFLTGGKDTPATLCRVLTDAGLDGLRAVVGENLSYPDERVVISTVKECAEREFAPLSVLLVDAAPRPCERAGGIADEDFIRGDVPMTKQEVRAAILAKLAVTPDDTVWDVGAGTGSVSVELALRAVRGRVFAVEYKDEACTLIEQNRERFGAWNLRLVRGRAPEALADLSAPDAVFVGGSEGALAEIIDAALRKNPNVRLCVSAIALETLSAALEAFTARGLSTEVTQIAVSRAKPGTRLHLLLANNPVFLISAHRGETI
ncbi:MAG: precorrin-6y C5,15-methyltransferase (decarboxylating) subunit CbiE [Ruminococcaceae bacterium]|nr:precorrin-6y C5,15-methyltransferase (decarboxylating) subunit CbiE [Oscillospiraceae bacterium]